LLDFQIETTVTLNFWERALINNPMRAFVQRRVETPRLLRLGGPLDGREVLEIGCGRGIGVEIIFQRFGAAHVTAIDIDPRMVGRAKMRLASIPHDRLELAVGSATAIPANNESFDAVFDFGILHHVPDWQRAVREIARVLRPGGLFFFEEVTRQALERWLYRTLFDHPLENRFGVEDFAAELARNAITVEGAVESIIARDFFVGVGRQGTKHDVR
jgi:ubiquinone/menaquinone biosynthesis C-methylase UbiE